MQSETLSTTETATVSGAPRYLHGVVSGPPQHKGKKCVVDTEGGLVYYGPLTGELPVNPTGIWPQDFEGALPFRQMNVVLDGGTEIGNTREIVP